MLSIAVPIRRASLCANTAIDQDAVSPVPARRDARNDLSGLIIRLGTHSDDVTGSVPELFTEGDREDLPRRDEQPCEDGPDDESDRSEGNDAAQRREQDHEIVHL